MFKARPEGRHNPYVIAAASVLVIAKVATFCWTTSSLIGYCSLLSMYYTDIILGSTAFLVGLITTVIIEFSLCLQLCSDICILVGLCKKKYVTLKVLLGPTAVCYTIEVLVFFFALLYSLCSFGMPLRSPIEVIILAVSILEKLLCGFLLFKIRNYYVDVRDGNTQPPGLGGTGYPKKSDKFIVLL